MDGWTGWSDSFDGRGGLAAGARMAWWSGLTHGSSDVAARRLSFTHVSTGLAHDCRRRPEPGRTARPLGPRRYPLPDCRPLDNLEERRDGYAQRLRKLVHVGERDVLFAAFYGACVGSVHAGGVGELLLAQSALAAQLAHPVAELAFPPV